MLSFDPFDLDHPLNRSVAPQTRISEAEAVEALLSALHLDDTQALRIQSRARALIEGIQSQQKNKTGMDRLLQQYPLGTEEGKALMCLAEAVLRIPDSETVDALIRDKLSSLDFIKHLGQADSMWVNAATWGLMLTGKWAQYTEAGEGSMLSKALKSLVGRGGEPMVRQAVRQAMRMMGQQFVLGQSIEEALKRSEEGRARGYRYSYDMLGEAAKTAEDAERYRNIYMQAIVAAGSYAPSEDWLSNAGISIKLSALHPRYEAGSRDRVVREVYPVVLGLAVAARDLNMGLTLDAEESDRLQLSLQIFERLCRAPELSAWNGLGLAVQAYQKRASYVLDWLIHLALDTGRRIPVRLVKGAYWDAEIKWAQERGLEDYPVFTRKENTDLSYLVCAQKMLRYPDQIFPQFATHNAWTAAAVLECAQGTDFEFQCLYGMGQSLYEQLTPPEGERIPCRVYAPVGVHHDLLPYLVRRLLENGANSSFVHQIVDPTCPIERLIESPVERVKSHVSRVHPRIPRPLDLYSPRKNSRGIDLADEPTCFDLQKSVWAHLEHPLEAHPLIHGVRSGGEAVPCLSPSDRRKVLGTRRYATREELVHAFDMASQGFESWSRRSVEERATIIERAGDLLERDRDRLMAYLQAEAGKTYADAIAEVREAVDFCRYYAERARTLMAPMEMPGPTGERNTLRLHPRGVMVCISPWNFPLAIFMGQVVASLVVGNAVLAKPAQQTTLLGMLAVSLLHEAGVPKEVLHYVPGKGSEIGDAMISDPRVAGVVFTGSTQTAQHIAKVLSDKPIITPLIAETGGINAMIVDSSALIEQVVQDVLISGFGSAGQRCSALRLLCVQDDIADRLLTMLQGAMMQLRVGDPAFMATDVGPVIDQPSALALADYIDQARAKGQLIFQCSPVPSETEHGSFCPPALLELPQVSDLREEIFGPVVHVVRYAREHLDKLLADIRALGYGLTMGIHTRIERTMEHILDHSHIGNTYVNRGMTGAVVGVQPFGGEGLSGTGPKAGGPYYLLRLCHERVVTINTVAQGGNASLLTLD